jgi:hypothetical protein
MFVHAVARSYEEQKFVRPLELLDKSLAPQLRGAERRGLTEGSPRNTDELRQTGGNALWRDGLQDFVGIHEVERVIWPRDRLQRTLHATVSTATVAVRTRRAREGTSACLNHLNQLVFVQQPWPPRVPGLHRNCRDVDAECLLCA